MDNFFKNSGREQGLLYNLAELKCGLLNANSAKKPQMKDPLNLLINNNDIIAITETKFKNGREANDPPFEGFEVPAGYDMFDSPRNTHGGGVAILSKQGLKLTRNENLYEYIREKEEKETKRGQEKKKTDQKKEGKETKGEYKLFETFEHISVIKEKNVIICVIYRPPKTETYRYQFFADLENYVTIIKITNPEIPFVLVGDFNIHVNDDSDDFNNKFSIICRRLELTQHVPTKLPTHNNDNTLDLILSNEKYPLQPIVRYKYRSKEVFDKDGNMKQIPSDHFAINFAIILDHKEMLLKSVESLFNDIESYRRSLLGAVEKIKEEMKFDWDDIKRATPPMQLPYASGKEELCLKIIEYKARMVNAISQLKAKVFRYLRLQMKCVDNLIPLLCLEMVTKNAEALSTRTWDIEFMSHGSCERLTKKMRTIQIKMKDIQITACNSQRTYNFLEPCLRKTQRKLKEANAYLHETVKFCQEEEKKADKSYRRILKLTSNYVRFHIKQADQRIDDINDLLKYSADEQKQIEDHVYAIRTNHVDAILNEIHEMEKETKNISQAYELVKQQELGQLEVIKVYIRILEELTRFSQR